MILQARNQELQLPGCHPGVVPDALFDPVALRQSERVFPARSRLPLWNVHGGLLGWSLILELIFEPEQSRLAHPCVPGDLLDGLVRLGEQVHGHSFLLLRRMFSHPGTTSEFEIRIQNLKFECDFIIFNCSFTGQKVLE